jgi:hypothetical protein
VLKTDGLRALFSQVVLAVPTAYGIHEIFSHSSLRPVSISLGSPTPLMPRCHLIAFCFPPIPSPLLVCCADAALLLHCWWPLLTGGRGAG